MPIGELSTDNGFVVHQQTGRRISYGDVAKFATVPAEPPKIAEADLKKPSEFRLIGREDISRVDVPSKVNGSAKYSIDAKVEGMIYASVLESPMDGAKATDVNIPDVMKIPGVTKVVPLPFGVAVFGKTVEATRAGRNALKVTWDTSAAKSAGFDSERAIAEYARHGRDPNAKAMTWFKKGDVGAAMGGAARMIEGEYSSEYCYHAQMEPMNCIAKTSADGKSVELWLGTQSAMVAGFVVSHVLDTTPDKIHVHQYLLGGGYGRRLAPDIAVQGAILSKVAGGAPVKLILTREDDVLAARPRPMTYHIVKAGLDASGKVVGWHHRLVAENVTAVAEPPRYEASGGQDLIGWTGLEEPYYDIPNILGEGVREERGTRVHPWRGIGTGYNKFAAESFVDEIAFAKGMDPLILRLELTQDHPRAQAVLKAAAEMAQWNTPRSGRGLGIAFSDYHGTFSAGVAEVSVDRSTGKIKVHNYWLAVDPGIVVQPVHAHAQAESAVVYGLSAALLEELTFKDGTIEQRNFNDYPVLRMADLPEIHTQLVASGAEPSGMGEIGVICVAPAIGNAVFQLTGKRIRALPMSPQRVKKLFA